MHLEAATLPRVAVQGGALARTESGGCGAVAALGLGLRLTIFLTSKAKYFSSEEECPAGCSELI